MKNREVFVHDPTQRTLVNDGVAKVTGQREAVLRDEVRLFVCEGAYADGLERILGAYLRNQGKHQQQSAWVSGFYGSGKSHFVKMLQAFWTDDQFSDGASPRSLAHLPQDTKDQLLEVSNLGRRNGGLFAAAGTLEPGAGDSFGLEVLSIVFKAARLPGKYPQANFVLWLKDEGIFDSVVAAIDVARKTLESELNNMYVSPHIAKALVKTGHFASNEDVRKSIRENFPPSSTPTIGDTIKLIKKVLTRPDGKFPATLLVLDEVQQYIGDSPTRSLMVQEFAEQCATQFDRLLLMVCTGQSALAGTDLLARLQGRFTISVQLQDTDVEKVIRQIILQKRADKVSNIEAIFNKHSGEVDKQLPQSPLGPRASDATDYVKDYPLLPTRKRFWEAVLRALDPSGTTAQLRNQLRIVYEATQKTAEQELGNVVSASFIYNQLSHDLLSTGGLLNEVNNTILSQKTKPDGDLRYDLCSLIFFISKLPRTATSQPLLRSDAQTLADLLVTDLRQDSTRLRESVKTALEALAKDGVLMQLEEEYRIQTRQGAEWDAEFKRQLADVRRGSQVGTTRTELLKQEMARSKTAARLTQGASATPREFELNYGADPIGDNGHKVPLVIKDGWNVDANRFMEEIRSAGKDSPIVYVYLPHDRASDLKEAIEENLAANQTLSARSMLDTAEDREARRSVETRVADSKRIADEFIKEIAESARVYNAGGTEIGQLLLAEKIKVAGEAALSRLFPNFSVADHATWDIVVDQLRRGDATAFRKVNFDGDPQTHPVCKAVLAELTTARKGNDIRKRFAATPYGWPQDAVDSALLALTLTDTIRATLNGARISARELERPKISTAEFRSEHIVLSVNDKIAIRKVYTEAGVPVQPGQESEKVREFIDALKRISAAANRERPAPAASNTILLNATLELSGNEQLLHIATNATKIIEALQQWKKVAEAIELHLPKWELLKQLTRYIKPLDIAPSVMAQVQAIEDNRLLLSEPDPVPTLLQQCSTALRDALKKKYAAAAQSYEQGMAGFQAFIPSVGLTKGEQDALFEKHIIAPPAAIKTSTEQELLATLEQRNFDDWQTFIDALPSRFMQAEMAARQSKTPKAVKVQIPRATISTKEELEVWLTEIRTMMLSKLSEGPIII